MELTEKILKSFKISKPQRKFLVAVFTAILTARGKINCRNLSRYSDVSEETYSRQFAKPFAFVAFNRSVIDEGLGRESDRIIVIDASFVSKSGKKTYGLDSFWNGCHRRSEKGLEVSSVAIVDILKNTGFTLSVRQTDKGEEPQASDARPKEEVTKPKERNKATSKKRTKKKGKAKSKKKHSKQAEDDETLLDQYLQHLIDVQPSLLEPEKYVVGDGYFSKKKYTILFSTDTELDAKTLVRYYKARFQIEFIFRDGKQEFIAEGYELEEPLTATVTQDSISWTERRPVIRSLKQAQAAKQALYARLEKAQAALADLNVRRRGKKRFRQIASLRQAAEAITKQHRVQDLLKLTYQEIIHKHPLRRYRDRPATVHTEWEVQVKAEVDEEALEKAIRRLGWRVYATNLPADKLSLTQAVLAYREQYIIERGLGRLKGKPLSLTPMYLQRDDHATGLIRLLSIGLRVLTLLEFVVRRRLATQGEELAGLYAGNPKRATVRPTAERLLEAFQEITLTVIQYPNQTHCYLTPLSKLQQRILVLLGFPLNTYTRLHTDSFKPP